jgi:hypothetical protein
MRFHLLFALAVLAGCGYDLDDDVISTAVNPASLLVDCTPVSIFDVIIYIGNGSPAENDSGDDPMTKGCVKLDSTIYRDLGYLDGRNSMLNEYYWDDYSEAKRFIGRHTYRCPCGTEYAQQAWCNNQNTYQCKASL